VKAADFADKLERGGADLVGSHRRVEVEKRFDISAHKASIDVSKLAEDSTERVLAARFARPEFNRGQPLFSEEILAADVPSAIRYWLAFRTDGDKVSRKRAHRGSCGVAKRRILHPVR